MVRPNNPDESTRQWRQRMIDETARFIEWGLQNPDKVTWIPKHPVGKGGFSERLKTIFWTLIAQDKNGPE